MTSAPLPPGWYNSAYLRGGGAHGRAEGMEPERRCLHGRDQGEDAGALQAHDGPGGPRGLQPRRAAARSAQLRAPAHRQAVHKQDGKFPERAGLRDDRPACHRGGDPGHRCRHGRRGLAAVDRRPSRRGSAGPRSHDCRLLLHRLLAHRCHLPRRDHRACEGAPGGDGACHGHGRSAALGGRALVAVNKAVVTLASAAIPFVPLYIALLYKVMKERGTHEGCIEQMNRLFRDRLYTAGPVPVDERRPHPPGRARAGSRGPETRAGAVGPGDHGEPAADLRLRRLPPRAVTDLRLRVTERQLHR